MKTPTNISEIFAHYFSGKWSRPDPVAILYSVETDNLYEVDNISLNTEDETPIMTFGLVQRKDGELLPSPESLYWVGWL